MRARLIATALVFATPPLGALAPVSDVSCSQNVFRIAATSPASAAIRDLAKGDFDGDGIPDIAVATGDGHNGIYVLLGRADGTFSPPQPFAEGINTFRVLAGKFDADEHLDAIGGPQLQFFAGNGDGSFQPGIWLEETLDSVSAADMDGDGKLDLVGSDGDAIVVLLGNGDGTFQPPIATATPWFLTAVAVGNVIGDEALDVVVAGSSAAPSVLIFPGSGDGHFGNPVSLGSSDSTHFVLLTDLDGNGQTDVVVDDNSVPPSGAVAVYLNQGNGMFDSPGHYPASPSGLLAADLDDDGHLDLVVPGSGSTGPGSIRLLFGLGDGTFGPGVDFVGGAGPTPTVAIDVLDTGLPSLVYPMAGERSISILDNRGERSFGGAPFTPTGFGGTAFVSGDFDEDGFPDLVTTFFPDFQNPDFFVLKGAGTGRFEPQTELELGQHVENLQTGHFSLSGHLDLLVQGTFGALFILSGNGDGTFGPEIGSLDSIEGSPPAIADLNDDGIDDIVALVQGPNGPDLASAITGGAFTPVPLPGFPGQIAAGRFDADPYPDIAVSVSTGVIEILNGNGDGSFDPGASYSIAGIGRIVTGDVDGDGNTDVVATRPQGTLFVLLGHGDGTFEPRQIGLGAQAQGLALGDFDGNGLDDVLTANPETGDASLLISLGGGAFTSPVPIPVGTNPYGAQAIDLTGDGRVDALVGTQTGVASLLNAPLGVAAAGGGAVVVGTAHSLHAVGSGFGVLTYRWRKGGVPLSDGGPISGATTPTLTIDPVSFADAGSYDVVVTDDCGSVTSNAASLSVEFADVPVSSPFHDDIITIATDGITSGCGNGNYCPTSPVRRDQMAVFLLKSEHGSAYTPPACSGVFADVPCPGPFTNWVEQLASEGVTGGCGGGNYCPDSSVTRAQMAIFLLKTSQGSSYTPPAAVGIFGDVPVGSFGADFIEDLYNRNITGGCQLSPLLYCPGSAVLRQQMATFLVRTFTP